MKILALLLLSRSYIVMTIDSAARRVVIATTVITNALCMAVSGSVR